MASSSANINRVAKFNSRDDEEMDRSLSDPSQFWQSHASNPELNSSSSVVAIPPINPGAQEPLEDLHVENADEGHEYGCKYCHKKFSNKQALGGHQNAHKIERAMEKSARALRDNQFGYFGGPSSYHPVMASSPPLSSPFNIRSHEFLNGATMNMPYNSQQPVHHMMHIGHFARSPHPMAGVPYAPHPLPGFNHVYPGWNAPVPRMYRLMAPPSHMQYPGSPPLGLGSSSAQPVFDPHSTFTGSRTISDRDLGGQNSNQMNNPEKQVEDPDLDLSLSL